MIFGGPATRGNGLEARARIRLGLLFSIALVLGGLCSPVPTEAQGAAKIPRVGYLTPDRSVDMYQAFLQGLREHGYVEGRNVAIEYRSAEENLDRLPALAAELVSLEVDVIVASATVTALAAKQATRSIPIVFPAVSDPVAAGLVTSFARPGGNITGLSFLSPELVGKSLELLKQVTPGVSRVAVLWHPAVTAEGQGKALLTSAEVTSRTLGVQLHVVGAGGPEDFDRAFGDLTRARAGALVVLSSTIFYQERKRLVDRAAKARIPAIYPGRPFAEAGGLMSYSPHALSQFRRAAAYVDKILKGAKPADLPVEQPTKFVLVINLKAAKALGLTIPQSVMARADHIIAE